MPDINPRTGQPVDKKIVVNNPTCPECGVVLTRKLNKLVCKKCNKFEKPLNG